MKKILLFSALVIAGFFIACGDDETTVKKPVASIVSITNQFFISGAVDHSRVNGLYVATSIMLNGASIYSNCSTNYCTTVPTFMQYGTNNNDMGFDEAWSIITDTYHMYVCSNASTAIPFSGWWKYSGAAVPALTFHYCNGITGNNRVSSVLQAAYTYSDPADVPEGTNTFQWLRGDTLTEVTNIITSANAVSYTLTTQDLNKYIKVVIVPVNTSGTSGNPVTSDAFGPVMGQ